MGLSFVYRSTFPDDFAVIGWNCLNVKKLLLLLLFFWAHAVCAYEVREGNDRMDLLVAIDVLEDPSGKLSFDEVKSPVMATRFVQTHNAGKNLNLGFSSSAYWLRFSLSKSATSRDDWLLEIPYSSLDQVWFYPPYGHPVITGSKQPLSSRHYAHRFFVFPLELQAQEQYFYLRVQSQRDLTVPLRIWTSRSFMKAVQHDLSLQFLYYGALLVLCIYNVIVAFFVRDKLFLIYAAYVLTIGLGMFAGNGYGRVFLWPDQPAFDTVAQSAFFAMSGAFLLLTRGFIGKKPDGSFERVWAWSSVFFAGIAAAMVLNIWVNYPVRWVNQTFLMASCLAGLLILRSIVKVMRRGQSGLRFFIASWVILCVGIFAATGRIFGWLPTNAWTAYSLQTASAFEMLMLFLALADQWRLERHRRQEAQRNETEIRKLYTATLRDAKSQLERTVKARTEQLLTSLAKEQQTLAQYVRFGAMISHEFRNPLAIINSQLSLIHKEHERGQLQLDKRLSILDSATRRLVRMFDKWMQSDQLNRSLEEIDPHSLPLPEWLQNFEQSSVHKLAGLRIELKLDPAASVVVADEYLLEIALTNLVDNAQKYAGHEKPVFIETRVKPGFVGIAVADQGPGIAPEYQQQVFEDYFRVSPESGADGLGLGLPIVRRIVLAHGGNLELVSAQGQGCSFCIWLPAKIQS